MKQPAKNRINTAISLIALIIAIFLLSQRLRTIHFYELVEHLRSISGLRLALILILTGISYWTLTGFDWIAIRFLSKRITYAHIAKSAFVGYSLSKNLGLSWLTGGSLRYRFYYRCGLTLREVSKLILFNTTTFFLGFLFWGGLSFTAFPLKENLVSYLPSSTLRLTGAGLLSVPALYLLFCFLGRKELRLRHRRWKIAPPRIALIQVTFGILDVFLTLSVLYLLLPPGTIGLPSFFSIFFTGQVLAILSHAPGGLGVFETVMFELMKDLISESSLLSALLLYRIVYFLLPLALGITLLAADEIRLRKGAISVSVLHPEKKSR